MKLEYRNKSLTKIFGSPYLGCYALAVAIFSLGLIRDALYVMAMSIAIEGANGRYERALRQQPHYEALGHPAIQAVGWGLVALGQTLVVTSIYALGITGKLSPDV
jgi:phosphatidylethanolamine N-methyltransferase